MAPRFSLRTLLTLTSAVAILAVLIGAYGRFFLSFLSSALIVGMAIASVTAAVYCRGARQAFFIGAACCACFTALNPPAVRATWGSLILLAAWHLLALAASGGLAVFTRRLIMKRGWNVPSGNREEPPK